MLVKCPECGNPVSSKAYVCPTCGFPIAKSETTEFEPIRRENAAIREAMNNSNISKTNDSAVKSETVLKSSKGTIWLGLAAVIGIAYLAYSVYYWTGVNTPDTNALTNVAQDSMEAVGMEIGAGIATALVFPHLVCTGIALLFNILATFIMKRGLALTAGILYSVAMVLFPMYFMFVVFQAIFCYIAFAKMKQ